MKRYKKIIAILLSLALIISTFGIFEVSAATNDTRYSKKYLQNGDFEENVENYRFSSYYTQPFKANVPYWDTTAYGNDGTNGMLEFFKAGAAHFNRSNTVNKVVAKGEVAAELNADEISTIYQRIETVSGSTYTWGLDHRGRDTTDTMVLFIGPEQYDESGNVIDPSKPSKTGQDQFVKMTEWLKKQYGISYPDKGCSQKYTIYSRPFAAKGEFQKKSSANENFSMTKTDECNQEWNLWVISSEYENKDPDTTKAIKGWSKYGTNRYNENEDSYNDVINGAGSKLGYDCTYTVPKGQTKTLFAFTSYSSGRLSGENIITDRTFGNLLDDINFKLYQPISSSITEGGTGGVKNGNATITNDLQNGNLFYSTVNDNDECTIHTKVTDGDTGHVFQGAYVTVHDDAGNPSTKFVGIKTAKDIAGLTDKEIAELSKQYFIYDTHDDGEKWDYFYTINVESPVHIHMMYTKAPYVLYDSNGGEPYQWAEYNSVGGNLVGFRDGFKGLTGVNSIGYYEDVIVKGDTDENGNYIEKITPGFYKSHAAVPNSKWQKNSFGIGAKFLNWTFNDADGNIVTINGEHQVTYDPDTTDAGYVKFNNLDSDGNITTDGAVDGLLLDATHGVTLTAQWQFGYTAQAQTLTDSVAKTYENTALGGWVEETFINDNDGSNVEDHTEDVNGETRVERTDAYGSVGEKIIFRATADIANNYVFEGWYKIKDGKYTLITTTPNLAITVEEGKSEAYYARFKTKTVPVIFYYSESGKPADYDYYDKNTNNKYGKHFQDVVYNAKAVPPKDDSKKVTMWFTSPTERDQEHLFDFSTPITKKTELYASPSFTFNYFNYFRFKEPWLVDVYATLKYNGKYIDMKNDADMTNYNIYMLKGSVGDTTPAASDIKSNYTKKVSKGPTIKFNQTTNTGQIFNRAGTSFNDFYIFNMKNPVWVLFDFTYKGITYTSSIKDNCLYNIIETYVKTENNQYFSTFPPEEKAELRKAQTNLLNSIKAMYEEVNSITDEPPTYESGSTVSGLPKGETSSKYTFNSTTAIRNIEPWGLKYTFSVKGQTITGFEDYGAVVLTDKSGTYTETPSISQILADSNSLLYSKANGNIYYAADSSVEIYHINDLHATDFDKNTYTVFFVKDSNGFHYSNIVRNSYNKLANAETDDETQAAINQSITNYSQALINYYETKKKYGITN